MMKALISDFSRTLLVSKDEQYTGGLNALYKSISSQEGFDFWEHFRLSEQLLAFYETLKGRLRLAVFTTEYIQEDPAVVQKLQGIFDEIFRGDRLGLSKTDPVSYTRIAEELHLHPQEVLYVDDKQENLDAAAQAGMNVIRFETEEQAIADIKRVAQQS